VSQVSDNDSGRTTLRTVARALAFLEYVALADRPPKVKDIAADLGLNITTCYHLFNTLQDMGYVARSGDGTVRIGSRVSLLYRGLVRHLVFGRDLRPIVAELSEATQETAYLASLNGNSVVILDVVEGSHAVRVAGLHVGFRGSEHLRASGKAVLAHLDEATQRSIIDPITQDMSNEARAELRSRLDRELERVRSQGWALDDREFDEGVCCVSAPIFGPDDEIAGSLTVSIPAERFQENRERIVHAVKQAGGKASRMIGHFETASANTA
jgi:IclR family acetate operon transcriptional repressor